MKKFFSYGLYIFMLLFSIALVLDIIYSNSPQLMEPDISDEKSVWNDIYNSQINVDLAIYGSSRAWVHVNPVIIDSILDLTSYNLGIDGYSFHMQHYRHKEYFKYNKKPQTIVVLVDWMSFNFENEGLYNSSQFRPHLLWNSNAIEHLSDNQAMSPLDFYVPFYRYNGRLNPYRSFIEQESPIVERVKGFHGFDKEWQNKNVKPFIKNFDNKTLKLFEEFLTDMKSQQVEVIMVVAPFYIEGQDIVINKDDNMETINKIASDFSVPVLDYSQSSLSFNKDLFYNNSHLNSKGAHLFSLELANDLKSLKTPSIND